MKTLLVAFKGKNNTSAQLVSQLPCDRILLTNSFLGLERDICVIHGSYDSVILFGMDPSLSETVRIEQTAKLDRTSISTQFDIPALSNRMRSYGIAHSVSRTPTQYLCNSAYYHMLIKNQNTVLIHIPSQKGMSKNLMNQLTTLFSSV